MAGVLMFYVEQWFDILARHGDGKIAEAQDQLVAFWVDTTISAEDLEAQIAEETDNAAYEKYSPQYGWVKREVLLVDCRIHPEIVH
jgi:hypothetical protein